VSRSAELSSSFMLLRLRSEDGYHRRGVRVRVIATWDRPAGVE
jgi:hypothetical protein